MQMLRMDDGNKESCFCSNWCTFEHERHLMQHDLRNIPSSLQSSRPWYTQNRESYLLHAFCVAWPRRGAYTVQYYRTCTIPKFEPSACGEPLELDASKQIVCIPTCSVQTLCFLLVASVEYVAAYVCISNPKYWYVQAYMYTVHSFYYHSVVMALMTCIPSDHGFPPQQTLLWQVRSFS